LIRAIVVDPLITIIRTVTSLARLWLPRPM
jgi:hypothetical protein